MLSLHWIEDKGALGGFTHNKDFACAMTIGGEMGTCRPLTGEAKDAFRALQAGLNAYAVAIKRPDLATKVDGLIGRDTRVTAVVLGRDLQNRSKGFTGGFPIPDHFVRFLATPSTLQLGIEAKAYGGMFTSAAKILGVEALPPPLVTPPVPGKEEVVVEEKPGRPVWPLVLVALGVAGLVAGGIAIYRRRRMRRRG
ncbi:MAG: hypothetical protein ACREJK_10075 [Candidatus Methylomirabilales bacterium]